MNKVSAARVHFTRSLGRYLGSITFVITVLAGCAVVPRPAHQDIYTNILSSTPPKAIANTVGGGSQSKVGVILSENTRKNIDWLQEVRTRAERGSPVSALNSNTAGADKAVITLSDPSFNIKWVVNSLKKRFGHVSLIDRIDPATQSDFTAIAIADLVFISNPNGVDSKMRLIILNNKAEIVGDAISNVTESDRLLNADSFQVNAARYHQSRVKALEGLDRELDKIVTAVAGGADRTGEPTPFDRCMERAVSVKDAKVRLKAMESCDQFR